MNYSRMSIHFLISLIAFFGLMDYGFGWRNLEEPLPQQKNPIQPPYYSYVSSSNNSIPERLLPAYLLIYPVGQLPTLRQPPGKINNSINYFGMPPSTSQTSEIPTTTAETTTPPSTIATTTSGGGFWNFFKFWGRQPTTTTNLPPLTFMNETQPDVNATSSTPSTTPTLPQSFFYNYPPRPIGGVSGDGDDKPGKVNFEFNNYQRQPVMEEKDDNVNVDTLPSMKFKHQQKPTYVVDPSIKFDYQIPKPPGGALGDQNKFRPFYVNNNNSENASSLLKPINIDNNNTTAKYSQPESQLKHYRYAYVVPVLDPRTKFLYLTYYPKYALEEDPAKPLVQKFPPVFIQPSTSATSTAFPTSTTKPEGINATTPLTMAPATSLDDATAPLSVASETSINATAPLTVASVITAPTINSTEQDATFMVDNSFNVSENENNGGSNNSVVIGEPAIGIPLRNVARSMRSFGADGDAKTNASGGAAVASGTEQQAESGQWVPIVPLTDYIEVIHD